MDSQFDHEVLGINAFTPAEECECLGLDSTIGANMKSPGMWLVMVRADVFLRALGKCHLHHGRAEQSLLAWTR